MSDTPEKVPPTAKEQQKQREKAAKDARLNKALRDNLRRRKAATRKAED